MRINAQLTVLLFRRVVGLRMSGTMSQMLSQRQTVERRW